MMQSCDSYWERFARSFASLGPPLKPSPEDEDIITAAVRESPGATEPQRRARSTARSHTRTGRETLAGRRRPDRGGQLPRKAERSLAGEHPKQAPCNLRRLAKHASAAL